ncbi:MAG: polymer-forming cytoskeletal protein [Oscillospiraceae bacterium]|nr:polymer-forming cytoskeletal protein [Oscillospiraceae bacterium]
MGIKENFTQAVKELTGGAKEQPEKSDRIKSSQVEDLRRAVEDEPVGQRLQPAPTERNENSERPEHAAATAERAVSEKLSAEQQSAAFPQNLPLTPNTPANGDAFSHGSPFSSASYTQNVSNRGQDMNQDFRNMSLNQQNGNDPLYPSPIYGGGGQAMPNSFNNAPFPVPPVRTAPVPQGRDASYANPNTNVFGDYANNYGMNGLGAIPQPQQNDSTMLNPYPAVDAMAGLNEELTVISRNTVIEGNVRSFANMNIDGNIRGDIETTKNIELNGKVIGNLTCNNAQMLTSQIQGNIRMKGNVLMGRDTLLIGDLVSTYAKVNGKIKGNLEIGGKAELKGDAVIFGDISASTITVDDGAIIQGYVSTTFLNKEESRNIFPESISIAE